MRVEVLHIEECPNWQKAGDRMSEALTIVGVDATVDYQLLETPEQAEATAFAGSPTITVDGVDLFPSDGRTADLACRIYFTPHGIAGLPTLDQLVERIHALKAGESAERTP